MPGCGDRVVDRDRVAGFEAAGEEVEVLALLGAIVVNAYRGTEVRVEEGKDLCASKTDVHRPGVHFGKAQGLFAWEEDIRHLGVHRLGFHGGESREMSPSTEDTHDLEGQGNGGQDTSQVLTTILRISGTYQPSLAGAGIENLDLGGSTCIQTVWATWSASSTVDVRTALRTSLRVSPSRAQTQAQIPASISTPESTRRMSIILIHCRLGQGHRPRSAALETVLPGTLMRKDSGFRLEAVEEVALLELEAFVLMLTVSVPLLAAAALSHVKAEVGNMLIVVSLYHSVP